MEELSKQMLELMKFQGQQQVQLQQQLQEQQQKTEEQQLHLQQQQLELQRELAEKQLQHQKDTEEKQLQHQKDSEEKFLDLKKLQLEHQKKTEERFELLTKAIGVAKDDGEFSQSEILSAMDIFYYNVDDDLTFEKYYRRYEDIFQIDFKSWPDQKKLRLLLRKLGSAEHSKFVDYILPKKTNELTFAEVVKLLMELYCPKTSLFHKRWKCMNLTHNEEDDFITFASIVNKHCDDFKLSELSADNFRSLIFTQGLISAKDAEIRRRVLNKLENEPNLTLQQIAEDCQRFISVKQDSKDIEESGIAHIKQVQHYKNNNYTSSKKHSRNNKKFNSSPSNRPKRKLPPSPCYGCGLLHFYNECDYKNKKCENCSFVGHKATHCRRNRQRKSYVKTTKLEGEDQNKRKYVLVKIRNKEVKLLLDSGSDLTILNYHTWKRLGKPTMLQTKKVARSVLNNKIKFEGEVITNVTLKDKTKKLRVFILKNTENLFGTDWLEEFELWDTPISDFCLKVENHTTEADVVKQELKENFPDVFSGGLGRCTKMVASFELKENTQPVFKKKRSVPFASLEKIDQELDRMVESGILSKVDYSDWAAPTVYVKKKNKDIRVCADFSTGLNAALKDYHYPLPSPEEIFNKLNGGKIFSKIDLSDAYLQIPLSEDSSRILCINTHRGLFKFNRLAFGVKVAPAIFQQIMDTMLSDFDFVISYLDDILLTSQNAEEHKKHVFEVFKRIQEYGFKVKENKCDFFLERIKYLGHIIDKDGRRPDPDRSIAIKNMPEPTNITSLQSFLGLANYYQSFIPKMYELRAPLNELLKKDKAWNWTPQCQTAFEKIKETLTSELFLTHFNPELKTIVASDASSFGIGACILHQMPDGSKKPIAHASRALLPAEKNYSQIEKEALGIIFAVTKFHRYLHGRKFMLQTDHKPLITIFGSKKGLPTHTANRLQRWGTILLNYKFNIEFVPSKKLGHADGLSRLIPKYCEPLEDSVIAALRTENENNSSVINLIRELPVTLNEIIEEAESDEYIKEIKEKLRSEDQLISEVFSICNDVLMYRERVVIPATLQKRILKDFHVGHPGATRMKSLMRSYVF